MTIAFLALSIPSTHVRDRAREAIRTLGPAATIVADDEAAGAFPDAQRLLPHAAAAQRARAWLEKTLAPFERDPAFAALFHPGGLPLLSVSRISLALALVPRVAAAIRAVDLLNRSSATQLVVVSEEGGPGLQGEALLAIAARRGVRVDSITVASPKPSRSIESGVRELRSRAADALGRRLEAARLEWMPRVHASGAARTRVVFFDSFESNLRTLLPIQDALESSGGAEVLWLTQKRNVAAALDARGRTVIDLTRLAPARGIAAVKDARRASDDAAARLMKTGAFGAALEIDGEPVFELLAEPVATSLRQAAAEVAMSAMLAGTALDVLRPGCVVTANDSAASNRPMLEQCRGRGIPTIGVQHGLAARDWVFPYMHGAADTILSWGDESARAFIEIGYQPSQVRLTGAALYDGFTAGAPSRDLRASLGLNAEKPVVVYMSQPPVRGDSERVYQQVALAFASAAAALSGAQMVVKLHPIEAPDAFWRGLRAAGVAQPRGVPVTVLKDCDTRALIQAAGVVVTQYSTTGLEAVLLDKPLVSINCSGLPDRAPYAAAGVAVGVERPDDLQPALTRVMEDPSLRAGLARAREAFRRGMFAYQDGQSAARCAREILTVATAGQHAPATAGAGDYRR